MKLSIYSIKETLFEGEVERVTLPTPQGEITVLHNHIPLITFVRGGEIKYYNPRRFESGWQRLNFSGGIAEVRSGSEVVLLADT